MLGIEPEDLVASAEVYSGIDDQGFPIQPAAQESDTAAEAVASDLASESAAVALPVVPAAEPQLEDPDEAAEQHCTGDSAEAECALSAGCRP